jgi:hypothetical protein
VTDLGSRPNNERPTVRAPDSAADRLATAKWTQSAAELRERNELRQAIRAALGGDLKAKDANKKLALLMLIMTRESA